MSVRVQPALPATAIFAASFSLLILSPDSIATAAETCLAAPNGPAPQGSHWFYRTERPSMRKCWRLVRKDRSNQGSAARTAPQPEPDDTETASVPAANSPAAPEAKPAPTPVIRELVTRNVSNMNANAQPLLPPDPSASPMPRAEFPAAPAVIVEQPAPERVAATDGSATALQENETPTLGLLLGAIALFAFFACAVFLVMEMVRRRTDVLNTVRNADRLPSEASPDLSPAADAPTFAPLPPIGPITREDDVDIALRRYSQKLTRRAA